MANRYSLQPQGLCENKTMEYMANVLPSVTFDLVETRLSGGDTVANVPSDDIPGFADSTMQLNWPDPSSTGGPEW